MQKYTAVIIDDEEDSRSNTRSMLQNYCSEIEVIGEAASGPEGKTKIQELKPHVVLLDINMPGMHGLQMLEGIYNRDFCVVFLIAYSEHGITAVKACATDYLLKPLILSELQGAIRKVVQHYESKPATTSAKTDDKNIVLISHSKGFTLVDFKESARFRPDRVWSGPSSIAIKSHRDNLPGCLFIRHAFRRGWVFSTGS